MPRIATASTNLQIHRDSDGLDLARFLEHFDHGQHTVDPILWGCCARGVKELVLKQLPCPF